MREQFEIRLDFKPQTGNPERIFLIMAEYVRAFEDLIQVVGNGVDPESAVSCELAAVEVGSLKSILNCIGKYCSTLAKVPVFVASHMVDFEEFSKEEQINDFADRLESDISADTDLEFPNRPNINRLELAKSLNNLTKAAESLLDGETVDVKAKDNVVCLNTRPRFSREPEDMFKEVYELKRKDEILLVKRPVFVGDSMWDFKSIQRNKAFSAPIEDKGWLREYQNREIKLEPGDAMSAVVEYIMFKEKGAKYFDYKDNKVMSVNRVVKSKELQRPLKLENDDEER